MGIIADGKVVPHFTVETPHGSLILIPRNTTRVVVYSDSAKPFTVNNTQVEHLYEVMDFQDGFWKPVNPKPPNRRTATRKTGRPIPRAAYDALLKRLCEIVETWAAQHKDLLWEAEGPWLESQLEQKRDYIRRLEQEYREALAELHDLEVRRHRRRGRGWHRRRRASPPGLPT